LTTPTARPYCGPAPLGGWGRCGVVWWLGAVNLLFLPAGPVV